MARTAAPETGAPSSAEMAVHLAERYRQADAVYLGEGEAAAAFLALPSPSASWLAAMVEAASQEAAKALRERVSSILAERGEVARRFLQDRALQRGGELQAADYAALVAAAEAGTLLPPCTPEAGCPDRQLDQGNAATRYA